MGSRDKLPRLFGAVLVCVVVAGCDAGGGKPCQMVHVTDLKLLRNGKAFYTGIQINGQPSVMQVDTGADDNLITEAAAHRLGMAVNVSGWDYVEGVGGTQQAGTARSKNVQLGDAHSERLIFTTVPDEGRRFEGDGLLGMSLFHDSDVDLDFWGGRVGLYKTRGACDVPRAAMAPPLYMVALYRPAENFSPMVIVTINGVQLHAVIDTGADQTTIFRKAARRTGLIADEVHGTAKYLGVGPREVTAEERVSAPVEIGDLTVEHLPVVIVDQRSLGDTDMLLGYDFVTKVHLWISHSSGTIIMQYPPQPSMKDEAPPPT